MEACYFRLSILLNEFTFSRSRPFQNSARNDEFSRSFMRFPNGEASTGVQLMEAEYDAPLLLFQFVGLAIAPIVANSINHCTRSVLCQPKRDTVFQLSKAERCQQTSSWRPSLNANIHNKVLSTPKRGLLLHKVVRHLQGIRFSAPLGN